MPKHRRYLDGNMPVRVSDWKRSGDPQLAAHAAVRICSILAAHTQPNAARPVALRPRRLGAPVISETPLTWQLGDGVFESAAWRPGYRTLNDHDGLIAKTGAGRLVDGTTKSMSKPRASRKPRRVPGIGGARPTPLDQMNADPFEELRSAFGEIEERQLPGSLDIAEADGATSGTRELDALGRGVLFARLSTEEAAEGQKLSSQIEGCLSLVSQANESADERLAPRFVIASHNNSAVQPFDHRPDLMRLFELVREGHVDFVVARSTDRIVRQAVTRAQLFGFLENAGVDLYLSDQGRKIDWHGDHLLLGINGLADEHEHKTTLLRTQRGVHTKFVGTGHGWIAAPIFGWYRKEARPEWHVDDVQQALIHRAFEEFRANGGSLAKLQSQMADEGWDVSRAWLNKLLRNPIYVTGERQPVNVKGERVACAPAPLPERPIEPALFQAVQDLLGIRKGSNTRTPVGTYPLNGITILHAACSCDRPDHTESYVGLKCRKYERSTIPRLYHWIVPIPDKCKGWSIPYRPVEEAVIRELHRLAEVQEVERQWRNVTIAGAEREKGKPGRTHERKKRLARLRELRQSAEDLSGRLIDTTLRDEEIALGTKLAAMQDEIKRLERVERAESALDKAGDVAAPSIEPAELNKAGLLCAIRETLTIETPVDPDHRRRRAAVIEACLSHLVIRDIPDGVEVELHGPLVPAGAPSISVLEAAQDILEPTAQGQLGRQSSDDPKSQTVILSPDKSTVRDFLLRPDRWYSRVADQDPFAGVGTGRWRGRSGAGELEKTPSWEHTVRVRVDPLAIRSEGHRRWRCPPLAEGERVSDGLVRSMSLVVPAGSERPLTTLKYRRLAPNYVAAPSITTVRRWARLDDVVVSDLLRRAWEHARDRDAQAATSTPRVHEVRLAG